MSPKIILSLIITLFMGFTTSPVRAGDIISCDSFEMCADGNPPLTNYVLELEAKVAEQEARIAELEAKVAEQEARIAELEAEVIERTASIIAYFNTTVDQFRFDAPHATISFIDENDSSPRTVRLGDSDLRNSKITGRINNIFINGNNFLGADLSGFSVSPETTWIDNICPDGSNSDTNGLGKCVALP